MVAGLLKSGLMVNGLRKVLALKKECRTWIRQMQDQIGNGLFWDAAKITMSEYLGQWFKDIDGTIKPRTLDQYASVVRNQLRPRLGKIKLGEYQPYHIQQVYSNLKEQGHRSRIQLPRALRRLAKHLSELYHQPMREEDNQDIKSLSTQLFGGYLLS